MTSGRRPCGLISIIQAIAIALACGMAAAIPVSWTLGRSLDEGTYDLKFIEPNVVGVGQLGRAVAKLGDVNGDGADDIGVGAYGYFNAAGRCYIYFGGADADSVPDVTLDAEDVTDIFGFAVAGAGDVNGDGYADVMVGAPGHGNRAGRSYLFFGGPDMDEEYDLALDGEYTMDAFGVALGAAGDINGDGYGDIIVGANGYNTNTGRTYVYYGGPLLDTLPDLILDGEETWNIFGITVAGPGDLNGDGWDDLCVGAPWASEGIGRAYVYFGGPEIDADADLVMEGEGPENSFAYAVAGGGDINGDGERDLVIGAPGYNSNMGRGYVFYGGASLDASADVIYDGEGGSFGHACAGFGDVNQDGCDDVLIGAPWFNNATGRAYLFFDGNVAVTFDGDGAENYLGMSVAIAGDFGGDTCDDLLIGLPGYNDTTGRAQLYFGAAAHMHVDLVIDGEGGLNRFGHSVAEHADVNGDGYDDIIVGATGYHSYDGRVYVYLGGPQITAEADIVMEGFGNQVASAGDVNGDGFDDIVIGSSAHNDYTGFSSVFFGGDPMDAEADVTMYGEAPDNYFGFSVAGAGDVNGDGFQDVVVGAIWNSNYRGRAYVFLGGDDMDNEPDLLLNGEQVWDELGWSVDGAGDVNADGYDDIIIGARGCNEDTGRSYVFCGGELLDANADVVLEGESAGGYFGLSVRGIHDVNGDGFEDVAVSSYRFNDDTGRVYLFYGGQTMDPAVDLVMDGQLPDDRFGMSIAGLSDMNGDGYDDLMVGADGYQDYAGRAYIYLGGQAMDDVADLLLEGEGPWQHFGCAGAGVGDVNGGGRRDVLVGAEQYPANGAAYLYFGESAASGIETDDAHTGETARSIQLTHSFRDNGDLEIDYDVASAGEVMLCIYDVTGQRVRLLVDGIRTAGHHRVVWDGRNDVGRVIASGIYYGRLEADGQTAHRKMLVLR